MAAAEACAALATDRVDLVDEDDRPAHLAGLLEQVADAAGADADEHLHEVRTGDREEADAGLTGNGAGEQCLAGARRADQQHALGHACADLAEALGHAQEVDDFGDLLLDAFVAGDVGEGGGRLVLASYVLARLRPTDMTLPIWPAARRCIQTKKPMINSTGRSRPAIDRNQLLPGDLKLRSTSCWRSRASSAADRPRSPPPVVLYLVPSLYSPVMAAVELLTSAVSTLPATTSFMNVV